MAFYGAQMSQGVNLPRPLTDYEDDPLQMAGNIIIDSEGIVVYLYSSQNPADRPSVEDVLAVLRGLRA